MKKIILALLLTTLSLSAHAFHSSKCTGMTNVGTLINLYVNTEALEMIVENSVHQITDMSKDNTVFYTEDYKNDNNEMVFLGLGLLRNGQKYLAVYNAQTNKVKHHIMLSCATVDNAKDK